MCDEALASGGGPCRRHDRAAPHRPFSRGVASTRTGWRGGRPETRWPLGRSRGGRDGWLPPLRAVLLARWRPVGRADGGELVGGVRPVGHRLGAHPQHRLAPPGDVLVSVSGWRRHCRIERSTKPMSPNRLTRIAKSAHPPDRCVGRPADRRRRPIGEQLGARRDDPVVVHQLAERRRFLDGDRHQLAVAVATTGAATAPPGRHRGSGARTRRCSGRGRARRRGRGRRRGRRRASPARLVPDVITVEEGDELGLWRRHREAPVAGGRHAPFGPRPTTIRGSRSA